MTVPEKVCALVERFERNLDAYKRGKYNETQVRREFIDPLFKSLGWDVDNEQGYAEAYKDVVHEDAIKVGRATKAPDYSFRIGGVRKFFVEAKKPSIDIKEDTHPAYQLRRYAWSAKLPLSILTDFEEFAVYDCRMKPEKTDKASKARTLYFTYPDYVQRWDDLDNIFSREAILKGSFDKYVESHKEKRGTAEVDVAFLQEIERWRDLLARNIALRNPRLTRRELNFAVQRTIDRIIFLRICEDRGIEEYGKLMALQNGAQVYARILTLFYHADDRYNSGIFHFKTERDHPEVPDNLTPELQIDDKVLKDILKNLYYPDSPYEFSVLPADILGQVYEQFLGKVIRLAAGHQAKVEEKPEIKKAGGVYYTPTYIVEYIVKHTVGELLTAKTPKQAEKLTILDPACGSGSFLLGAYQYLLDWHRDAYLTDNPDKWSKGRQPRLYQNDRGEWKLTIEERKRILLNHIYGVDIDSQAVEVTKLSLLLKVLEGEDEQTLTSQLSLFQKRVLPDLSNNIKCGNSLIGSDFYEGKQLTFLDEEEMYRINAFDWDKEFPEIMQKGGFDVVIGNPPYIRIHNLVDFYPEEARFIQNNYSTTTFGKVDIYVAFIEKGVSLLKKAGTLGFIVPNKFMQADYGVGLRRLLSRKQILTKLVDFGNTQVFKGATTYTCLVFLSGFTQEQFQAKFNRSEQSPQQFLSDAPFEERPINLFGDSPWQSASATETRILEKLEYIKIRLSDVVQLAITGVKTGANSIFVFERIEMGQKAVQLRRENTGDEVELETNYLVPYLKAESLKRYYISGGSRLLLYPYQLVGEQTRIVPETEINKCSMTWQYLLRHKRTLEGRQKGKLRGSNWYGLSFASSLRMFSAPKVVTPTLSPKNSFSIDTNGNFFPQGAGGGCGLVFKDEFSTLYILGLLNSRLLTFFFQRISSPFQGGWFAYEPRYLNRIPICSINFSDPADKAKHDEMVELVQRMLDLHKQMHDAKLPQAQTLLQRQVDATDHQIDRLVYELYGLTEEEIQIVEKGGTTHEQ